MKKRRLIKTGSPEQHERGRVSQLSAAPRRRAAARSLERTSTPHAVALGQTGGVASCPEGFLFCRHDDAGRPASRLTRCHSSRSRLFPRSWVSARSPRAAYSPNALLDARLLRSGVRPLRPPLSMAARVRLLVKRVLFRLLSPHSLSVFYLSCAGRIDPVQSVCPPRRPERRRCQPSPRSLTADRVRRPRLARPAFVSLCRTRTTPAHRLRRRRDPWTACAGAWVTRRRRRKKCFSTRRESTYVSFACDSRCFSADLFSNRTRRESAYTTELGARARTDDIDPLSRRGLSRPSRPSARQLVQQHTQGRSRRRRHCVGQPGPLLGVVAQPCTSSAPLHLL